jgi:hypothetical protein
VDFHIDIALEESKRGRQSTDSGAGNQDPQARGVSRC